MTEAPCNFPNVSFQTNPKRHLENPESIPSEEPFWFQNSSDSSSEDEEETERRRLEWQATQAMPVRGWDPRDAEWLPFLAAKLFGE